jgi:cellulose synthase/poly-beta-1,6-N-acetylglucosamine synthase-like glycosyltransferase
MRQEEAQLIEATNELAWGSVSEETVAFIQTLKRPLQTLPFNITHLCALNVDANLHNIAMLADVHMDGIKYMAEDSGEERELKKLLVEKVNNTNRHTIYYMLVDNINPLVPWATYGTTL